MNPQAATLIAVLIGAGAHADGLKDLQSALAGLTASGPVEGRLTITRSEHNAMGKTLKVGSGEAEFQVTDGPSGTSVSCRPDVLATPKDSAGTPEDQTSTRATVIRGADLARVHFLLDGAADLQGSLEGAQLVEEKPSPWQDQPARMLRLKERPVHGSESGASADVESSLTMWIDAEGFPLALEKTSDLEAGVLMLKVKNHVRTQRRFLHKAGRLVIAEETVESETKALSAQAQSRQVTTVELK